MWDWFYSNREVSVLITAAMLFTSPSGWRNFRKDSPGLVCHCSPCHAPVTTMLLTFNHYGYFCGMVFGVLGSSFIVSGCPQTVVQWPWRHQGFRGEAVKPVGKKKIFAVAAAARPRYREPSPVADISQSGTGEDFPHFTTGYDLSACHGRPGACSQPHKALQGEGALQGPSVAPATPNVQNPHAQLLPLGRRHQSGESRMQAGTIWPI